MRELAAHLRSSVLRHTALVAAIASAPLAVAQSPQRAQSDDNGPVLEEIVVTAQGREQSLADVPVAVSVVSGEALEEFSLTSVEDVSERLPSVDIRTGPSDGLSIRGIGSGNNRGFQQSVGIYVDGAYRSRSRSIHAALFDIDRVEVLKGPQTTFFGANSIAGALSITTRKPGHEFDWNVSSLYGTDGEYSLEGGVDLPVADNFQLRLAARTNGMDGYIDTPRGDAPKRRNEQFRVSFSWQPTDFWQSDFRIDYGESETEGALAFQLVGCPVPEGYPNGTACSLFLLNNNGDVDDELDYHSDTGYDYISLDHTEGVWTNTFDVGDASTLMLKTAYYDHDADSLFTGIPFPHSPQAPLPPFLGPVEGVSDPFPLAFIEQFEQFSQEVRFQTDTGGFLDLMVGAYYDEQEAGFQTDVNFFFNDFGAIIAGLGVPGSTIQAGDYIGAKVTNDIENETYSAFAAFTLRPTDRTTINIGGRYTRFDKWATRTSTRGFTNAQGTSYELFGPADDFAANLVLGGDSSDFDPNNRTDEDFMPSLSVQYDLLSDAMVYGSYSKGFKAGGYSASNTPDTFEPEYVDAYEIGMKGTFLEGKLGLNLAAFLNEYEDFQETVVVSQGVTLVSVVRNAGKLEASGVELDATLSATDDLSFSASLAYLDSIYEEFANAPCHSVQTLEAGGSQAPCVQDLSGKRRGFAPEWSGTISANWAVPIDNYRLSFMPVVSFTDEYFLNANADPWQKQDSYAKVDLRASLTPADEKWSLALIGKNLTDETTVSFSETITNSDGSLRQIVERPLSVALQFTMRR